MLEGIQLLYHEGINVALLSTVYWDVYLRLTIRPTQVELDPYSMTESMSPSVSKCYRVYTL